MESECFDGSGTHQLPLLRPPITMLLCQLHQAGYPPDKALGVEGG